MLDSCVARVLLQFHMFSGDLDQILTAKVVPTADNL